MSYDMSYDNVCESGSRPSEAIGLREDSVCMPGRVSTAMCDCLWAGEPSRYVTSHLGQLSLPSLRGR